MPRLSPSGARRGDRADDAAAGLRADAGEQRELHLLSWAVPRTLANMLAMLLVWELTSSNHTHPSSYWRWHLTTPARE